MAPALQRAWLRRGALARLLLPLSWCYAAVTAFDRWLHATGLRTVHRMPVPVIVVGNVVAGGAGKTPVVIALVDHLRAQGLHVGVVSRGYGRRSSGTVAITRETSADLGGDEPLLIHLRTGAPVVVARRRADAARALLAAHPETQVIVCDDGLQHHALARDVEICVFDERGAGNGWLLPAGPLRERWPREVAVVLQHGAPAGLNGDTIERELAAHAVRADGTRHALADLRGTPVNAVAGIARPEVFFDALRAAGLILKRGVALRDHHTYTAEDVALGPEPLLCTEKDAVKVWALRPDAWAVPLLVKVPQATWSAIDRLLQARLSSLHGSPPA
jgi:tetraacyldisaccharide 4'-kinase